MSSLAFISAVVKSRQFNRQGFTTATPYDSYSSQSAKEQRTGDLNWKNYRSTQREIVSVGVGRSLLRFLSVLFVRFEGREILLPEFTSCC